MAMSEHSVEAFTLERNLQNATAQTDTLPLRSHLPDVRFLPCPFPYNNSAHGRSLRRILSTLTYTPLHSHLSQGAQNIIFSLFSGY